MMVALGNSVPELATTVLSFMGGSISMAELGLASNIGTAMFVITVAPAIAIYFNQDTAFIIDTDSKMQNARMDKKLRDKIHKDHWNQMMKTIYRDMIFLIMGFLVYDILLLDRMASWLDVLILLAF